MDSIMVFIRHLRAKFFLVFILIFSANAYSQSDVSIVPRLVDFGFRASSNRNVIAIIVHSTFNNSGGDVYDVELVINQFRRYGVSSHYLIDRDGKIILLVDEKNVAFHAGKSELPNGHRYVNSLSIGIELMTSFDDSPTQLQINALAQLVEDIRKRHRIEYVLRHSDIAPGRKTDPWNMDWDAFLKEIGL